MWIVRLAGAVEGDGANGGAVRAMPRASRPGGAVVKPTVCGACGWRVEENTLSGAWRDEKGSEWCGAGFPHYPSVAVVAKA